MFKQKFLMFSYYFIYSLLYSNYSKGFGDDIIELVRGMLGMDAFNLFQEPSELFTLPDSFLLTYCKN